MSKRFWVLVAAGLLLIVIFFNTPFVRGLYSVIESFLVAPDLTFVKENHWVHETGFKVGRGDYLDFQKNSLFRLSGDTIFVGEVPKAKVIRLNKYFNELK